MLMSFDKTFLIERPRGDFNPRESTWHFAFSPAKCGKKFKTSEDRNEHEKKCSDCRMRSNTAAA